MITIEELKETLSTYQQCRHLMPREEYRQVTRLCPSHPARCHELRRFIQEVRSALKEETRP